MQSFLGKSEYKVALVDERYSGCLANREATTAIAYIDPFLPRACNDHHKQAAVDTGLASGRGGLGQPTWSNQGRAATSLKL